VNFCNAEVPAENLQLKIRIGETMSNIAEVNDTTFEMEVLRSKQPVLVDFWASWCGPCLAVAPVVDQIAANYEGRLKVMKMNVDENNETAARYNIRGIPALLIFKDGKLADHIVGSVPKDKLDLSISKALA
jgi:thioredoxin 1